MRKRARVDTNQKEIVEALRRQGATVLHLHTVGRGCPDILVGYQGENFLLELKDGSKSASKQKLTPDEVSFFESWCGQVTVVNSIESAIALLNTPPSQQ